MNDVTLFQDVNVTPDFHVSEGAAVKVRSQSLLPRLSRIKAEADPKLARRVQVW